MTPLDATYSKRSENTKRIRSAANTPLNVGLKTENGVNPRYTARSIADLLGDDERISDFASVKSGMVFNNDALTFADGRSILWATGMIEPDVVLGDLVSIFHPGKLPGHQMKYY